MKHKVIGWIAAFALFSALGIFGIYLRAGESNPPAPQPPADTPAGQPAVAPVANGEIQLAPNGGKDRGPMGAAGGRGKGAVELGPKQILATATAPVPPAKDGFVNPKVEPGKVNWHGDFDTACKAAAKTGKPVLLFQMMGKLDDQFC
jgi:hypothetical protein